MITYLLTVITAFSCVKNDNMSLNLSGEWGVVETTLFVNDSLYSSQQLNEINTHYFFNGAVDQVEIKNDGITEHYDCAYSTEKNELVIGEAMTYEVEWLTPDAVYFHRHYGIHHSRYKLLLE